MSDKNKLGLYGLGTFFLGLGVGRLEYSTLGFGIVTIILGLIIFAYSFPAMNKAVKKLK
jgi:tetrahydromethanopterin S-methyltransferase subunit C